MARQPEPPARPWWMVPVLVVLAFFGVVFLVRTVIGFVAGIFTVLVVVALIVGGIYLFTKKD
jgi:antibiotic biosynthesis monooxygenase (ABM) superfamily enzyme